MSTIGNKGTRNRVVEYTFVASQDGQTSFSGADAFGVILSFRNAPGLNRISVNGQKISRQSYTLVGSTTFNLASGVPKGTIVEFEALYPFNAVDGYITAAADAAFGKRRNFVFDPGFRVSQENVNNAVAPANNGIAYGSDSLYLARSGSTGAATIQRTLLSTRTPGGSSYYNRITITTANASPAAGDYLLASTKIEALDYDPLKFGTSGAKNIVVRASLRSSVVGTLPIAIQNGAGNRSYVGSVTFSAADVGNFVLKTLFLTADTSGTWAVGDNTVGVSITFGLQVGTTYQGVTGWQSGNYLGLAAGTNFMATANATLDIADLGLYDVTGLTNGVVPPFELDEFQRDVIRCMRYYQKTYPLDILPGTAGLQYAVSDNVNAAGYLYLPWVLPVEMRIDPSNATYNPNSGASGSAYSSGGTSAALSIAGNSRKRILLSNTSNFSSGQTVYQSITLNARL